MKLSLSLLVWDQMLRSLGHYACAFVSVNSLTSFSAPSSCLEGELSDIRDQLQFYLDDTLNLEEERGCVFMKGMIIQERAGNSTLGIASSSTRPFTRRAMQGNVLVYKRDDTQLFHRSLQGTLLGQTRFLQLLFLSFCLRDGALLPQPPDGLLVLSGAPLVLQSVLQLMVHVLQLLNPLQVLLQLSGLLGHLLLHLLPYLTITICWYTTSTLCTEHVKMLSPEAVKHGRSCSGPGVQFESQDAFFKLFSLIGRLQFTHPQLQLLLLGLLLQPQLPSLLSSLAVRRWPALAQQAHTGLNG
ncbi:hypothetical protein FQN60_014278 [Etheostoma spectabile]|uniref:Uncharacterized protein n=1 Tax=Etheostoma spectabile TaxID=54343 RepID=A0A5J5DA59_9PERO|nr:hypothetical protein FQN60_014278 [Etheostoma spectabile]